MTSWWWARRCSKHVEDCNKRIIKQKNCASSWSFTKVMKFYVWYFYVNFSTHSDFETGSDALCADVCTCTYILINGHNRVFVLETDRVLCELWAEAEEVVLGRTVGKKKKILRIVTNTVFFCVSPHLSEPLPGTNFRETSSFGIFT